YSEAFAATKNPLYQQVIEETLKFVNLELTSPEGGFYSALDADSEGEEGKFYVWTKKEIEEVTGDDADLVKTFYGIDQEAYWEEGKNVLIREASFESLSLLFNLTEKAIKEKIASAGQKLFQHRSKRVRPGLDDKILTSWNALMLKGYVDAFKALGEQKYLDAALQNAAFLRDKLQHPDGSIYRNFKNDKASIPGFLDDYAFTIEAYNALYEVTFDDKWINMAMELADYTLNHFYSEKSGMFFYTSDRHTDVITRKTEVLDNVIPASNSAMAKGLFQLGLIFEKPEYLNIPVRMLNNVNEKMAQFPSAFSNWGILLLQIIHPYYTFVITGEEAHKKKLGILKEFHPDIFMAGSTAPSELPLFYQRFEKNKTRIFVCSGKECKAPVTDAFEALSLLSS
ncbi:MAG: thioredoxin domain-containing protein, partial [Bacteroidales bacterium]|nr:thioredoxin domain-containing protein [Bacteroidales bacterium]